MHTPYLIQRAEINLPLGKSGARLSQVVSFDYMGSAEFEFGALPQSFRRIEAVADSWVCRLVPDIRDRDEPLRVYSALSDSEFEEYKTWLLKARDPQLSRTLHTKESVRFASDYSHGKYSKTDFWWDIDNDVMFGFNTEFMALLGMFVANSLAYMNEQKAKK